MINSFRGRYSFLSNFHPALVPMEGRWYPSTENAYQAAKVPNEEREPFTKCSAAESKKLGKQLKSREDWHEVKLQVMEELLRRKFLIPDLKEKLLETGDEELIEGNYWHDTFWGVCNGEGQNHLGRLLMEIREELKNEL